MKVKNQVWTLVIIVLILIISSINVSADQIAIDSFNRSDRNLNGDTADNGNSWSCSGACNITSNEGVFGSQGNLAFAELTGDNETYNVTWYVKPTTVKRHETQLLNGGTQRVRGVYFETNNNVYVWDGNGAGGGSNVQIITGYTANAKYEVKIVDLDFANNDFNVMINGTKYDNGGSKFSFWYNGNEINTIRVNIGSGGGEIADEMYIQTPTAAGWSNTVPEVTLVTPTNNTHNNTGTIEFIFDYEDIDGNESICELKLNSTGYGRNTSVTNNTRVTITNNATIPDGSYDWTITCDDGNQTISDYRGIIIDTVNPILTWKAPTTNTITYNEIYNFNVTAQDTWLFAYNYSLYNSSNEIVATGQVIDLNVTTQNINATFNFTNISGYGQYTINVTVSDDHTAREIPEYDYWIEDNSLWFYNEEVMVNITAKRNELNGITVERQEDRYTFGFEYNNNKKKREYILTSNEKIYYREMYEYPVFVIGGHWTDFNIPGENIIYTVTKISNTEWKIETERQNGNNNEQFESIGGLNIVTEAYTITYTDSSIATNNTILPTTAYSIEDIYGYCEATSKQDVIYNWKWWNEQILQTNEQNTHLISGFETAQEWRDYKSEFDSSMNITPNNTIVYEGTYSGMAVTDRTAANPIEKGVAVWEKNITNGDYSKYEDGKISIAVYTDSLIGMGNNGIYLDLGSNTVNIYRYQISKTEISTSAWNVFEWDLTKYNTTIGSPPGFNNITYSRIAIITDKTTNITTYFDQLMLYENNTYAANETHLLNTTNNANIRLNETWTFSCQAYNGLILGDWVNTTKTIGQEITINVKDGYDNSAINNVAMTIKEEGIPTHYDYTFSGTTTVRLDNTSYKINLTHSDYEKYSETITINDTTTELNITINPRKINIIFSTNTTGVVKYNGGEINFTNVGGILLDNDNVTAGNVYVVYNNETQAYGWTHNTSTYIKAYLIVRTPNLQKPFNVASGIRALADAQVCANYYTAGQQWHAYCGITDTEGNVYINVLDDNVYVITATKQLYESYSSEPFLIPTEDLTTYEINLNSLADIVGTNQMVSNCVGVVSEETTCRFTIKGYQTVYSSWFIYDYNNQSNQQTAKVYNQLTNDAYFLINETYNDVNVTGYINGQAIKTMRVKYDDYSRNTTMGFASFTWAQNGLNKIELTILIIFIIIGSIISGMLAKQLIKGGAIYGVTIFIVVFAIVVPQLWALFFVAGIIISIKLINYMIGVMR